MRVIFGKYNECKIDNIHPMENFSVLISIFQPKSLDFCLQLISSRRINLSNYLKSSSFLNISSSVKGLPSAILSSSWIPSKGSFFCFPTLPNTTSFHFFQIRFQCSQLARQHITRGSLKTIGPSPCIHLIHKAL
jgi:hypothetical protein